MELNSQRFTAKLIASRYLPREDNDVRRLLVDLGFRQEVEVNLAACGMRLLDHPFAAYVAVALMREAEGAVFDDGEQWRASNIGLPKDAIALLVVLWALIILPKRERQLGREPKDGQGDMFGNIIKAVGDDVSRGIAENVLLEDFGKLLGGKSKLVMNLGTLKKLGLVEQRNKVIYEGPLLDLVFDYAGMAPRIINGAMSDLIYAQNGVAPLQDTNEEDEINDEISGEVNGDGIQLKDASDV